MGLNRRRGLGSEGSSSVPNVGRLKSIGLAACRSFGLCGSAETVDITGRSLLKTDCCRRSFRKNMPRSIHLPMQSTNETSARGLSARALAIFIHFRNMHMRYGKPLTSIRLS